MVTLLFSPEDMTSMFSTKEFQILMSLTTEWFHPQSMSFGKE